MWASDPRFLLLVSVPHRTNKILKKTTLDISFFLGFTFDGRPIKFQIHSCRGNIVEINAYIRPPTEKKVGGARAPSAPPVPPPMVLSKSKLCLSC